MAQAPDPAFDLRRALETRAGGWPAPLEHHATLGSTNDRLRALAVAGAPEWTVVTAEHQTRGRGRLGRTWISPPGNLHLSVLLRPRNAADVGALPLVAGLAVAEAVRSHGVRAEVKWPNDVEIGGRKLAGVLAEAQSSGTAFEWVCLGVGVNLAADPAEFAPEVEARRVSLAELVPMRLSADALAAEILVRLRAAVGELAAGRCAQLIARWRAVSVPWWGEAVEVEQAGARLTGIARGVDPDGALVLELPDGRAERVLSGEARRLRPLPAEAG